MKALCSTLFGLLFSSLAVASDGYYYPYHEVIRPVAPSISIAVPGFAMTVPLYHAPPPPPVYYTPPTSVYYVHPSRRRHEHYVNDRRPYYHDRRYYGHHRHHHDDD